MSIQSFLDSGLLESYILGQCTPDERALVEKMLAEHESVRQERDAVEQALEQYAQAQAITPPGWMKGRIAEQIKAEKGVPPKPGPSGGNTLPILLGIAALAMGLLLFQIRNDRNQIRQQLAAQDAQLQACAARDAEAQQARQQIAFLTHPDTKPAPLKWLDAAAVPQGLAVTSYYNPTLAQTFLNTAALPTLGADQDYQFWVITEGATAPIPLDTFRDANGWTAIQYRAGAVKFAVSLEPKGGSPNGVPTKVLMLGDIVG